MSQEAGRVLRELNAKGMAVTSAQALFPQQDCYQEMQHAVAELEQRLADEVNVGRQRANEPQTDGSKPYLIRLLGEPELDRQSIWARFAFQPEVVQIANEYYRLRSNLSTYNVWHNFATHAPARASQLWHRDPEDRYILKAFVYLTDVGLGHGPFTYACGTHPKGPYQTPPEYLFKEHETTRSDDTQMARVAPADQWLTCVGPMGTIVFADTRGYHKGGLAREGDRIVYVAEFLSPGAGWGGIPTPRV
jgi:hypothetical protein